MSELFWRRLLEYDCYVTEEGQDEYEKDGFIVDEEEEEEPEEAEDSDEEVKAKKKKRKKRWSNSMIVLGWIMIEWHMGGSCVCLLSTDFHLVGFYFPLIHLWWFFLVRFWWFNVSSFLAGGTNTMSLMRMIMICFKKRMSLDFTVLPKQWVFIPYWVDIQDILNKSAGQCDMSRKLARE